ncbi:MAG TPA: hypothetical protein VE591_11050 [Candidatus Acidoferrum sp.]|nr:hypothetical protein [Candidatus Acidoferrum sp.]
MNNDPPSRLAGVQQASPAGAVGPCAEPLHFPALPPISSTDASYRTGFVSAPMDCPDNLDLFLRDLLKEEGGAVQLDDEDKAFIDRILRSITQGSKGVFVVLHPNDRMQYMLLNTNRAGAIALLAKVMQRTAEALEADLD